jgi:acyl carrier protein
MTTPTTLSIDETAALETVVLILRELTADYGIDIPLAPHLELQDGLGLDSIDLAELSAELWTRYDGRVNLAEHCSRLEFDAIARFSLGDIARFVASATSTTGA